MSGSAFNMLLTIGVFWSQIVTVKANVNSNLRLIDNSKIIRIGNLEQHLLIGWDIRLLSSIHAFGEDQYQAVELSKF